MKRGYIPIWRKFFEDHPFWKEKRKFSKAEAWIDILQNTHFDEKPKKRLINGIWVVINYSECLMTTRYCARRWGWSNSTVARFLDTLVILEQISKKIEHQMTHITVLNYSVYDLRRNAKCNKARTVVERSSNELKNVNNVKIDKDPAFAFQNEPFSTMFPEKIVKKIETSCDVIFDICNNQKISFNPYRWIQFWINKNGHPIAMIDTLDALIQRMTDKKQDPVSSPWSYLDRIFKTKNGNYYERENIRQAEQHKYVEVNEKIKSLIAGIGQ